MNAAVIDSATVGVYRKLKDPKGTARRTKDVSYFSASEEVLFTVAGFSRKKGMCTLSLDGKPRDVSLRGRTVKEVVDELVEEEANARNIIIK